MAHSRWLSSLDRSGRLPEGREPAAHRVVQDPRARTSASPGSASRNALAGSWRPAPATTRRASHWRPRLLGIKATIFMPVGAALPKVAATEGYGADIQFHGSGVTEALVPAREFAERTGAVLIHPFDHEDIIAGQGTLGLEVLEQCPGRQDDPGAARRGRAGRRDRAAAHASDPDLRIIGVQAADAAAYPASHRRPGNPVVEPDGQRRWPTASRSPSPAASRSGSSPRCWTKSSRSARSR